MATRTWEGSSEPEVQAEPLEVQGHEHRLSLYELEAATEVVGQALAGVKRPGDASVGNAGRQFAHQAVAQGAIVSVAALELAAGQLHGLGQTHSASHVLGARPAVTLLGAAQYLGLEGLPQQRVR
jgi:hypothetical protein